ncbi:30S ribosome-binding factor RbfA [Prochlorococcus sp. MIT 1223]|uniref:30S ribosome-binding factor RbfA n=1 Tax=Prochlorococcus sp. MIT 1223 TaxID=3096217 RepID=UPI002A74FBDF|nr:30S ribosome-binding factor RbfA [Prochlorococcus sp. MIT 1223]
MANSRRVEKFSSLIRKEVSQLIMQGLIDPKIATSIVTITGVQVSNDLQHCRIFVSLFGADSLKEDVFAGLENSSGFLKGELARRLKMRRAPEIVFKLDKGIEKGTSVLGLLDELQRKRKNKDDSSSELNQDL